MKEALLNLDSVFVEQNSNLGQLITELKKRSKQKQSGQMMKTHNDCYNDGHSDYGHTDYANYGDNYSDSDRSTHTDSGCFITTATLNAKGCLDDNCYELTLARLFRDNYVKDNHPELLVEYRKIAPDIVASINKQDNKLQIYNRIWDQFLLKCLSCIENNDFKTATKIYKDMVLELKETYL